MTVKVTYIFNVTKKKENMLGPLAGLAAQTNTTVGTKTRKERVCSVTLGLYGDSWRFMIIQALRNNNVEHQSYLNALSPFFLCVLLDIVVVRLKNK